MGYGDFEDHIGKLKRAAIDAWMCHDSYWNIRGDHYEISSRSSKATVTVPDAATGEGGGDWSGDFGWLFGLDGRKDEEFSGAFATIRESIDTLVDPWRTLPDPAALEAYVEQSRLVTSRLSAEAWSDGTSHRPAGVELHGSLNSIDKEVEGIRGATGTSFRRNFLEAIPLVIDGILGISLVRGGAVTAQQGLWEAAREDVDAIIVSATAAFNGLASGGSGDLKRLFEVTGWALKGLKVFAPGIVGKAIDLGSVGVEIGKSEAPDQASESFGSYEEGVTGLQKGLRALSDRIEAEEEEIAQLILGHFTVYSMSSYRGNYDLQSVALDRDSDIRLDPERVEMIAGSLLPAVALELNTVADLNTGCASHAAVARGAGIGRGSSGPMDETVRMNRLIHDLLEDLAAESLEGAVQLKLALRDFEATEAEIIAEINRIAADAIADRSGGIGEDLDGDISNITDDRVQDPLENEIVVHSGVTIPYKPGYGPEGDSSLQLLMQGGDDE